MQQQQQQLQQAEAPGDWVQRQQVNWRCEQAFTVFGSMATNSNQCQQALRSSAAGAANAEPEPQAEDLPVRRRPTLRGSAAGGQKPASPQLPPWGSPQLLPDGLEQWLSTQATSKAGKGKGSSPFPDAWPPGKGASPFASTSGWGGVTWGGSGWTRTPSAGGSSAWRRHGRSTTQEGRTGAGSKKRKGPRPCGVCGAPYKCKSCTGTGHGWCTNPGCIRSQSAKEARYGGGAWATSRRST